jgi:hypothetical protein
MGSLKKKGETEMIETQVEKRNFSEWCQLQDEKRRIETDQKIWAPDSVNFQANASRLKKITAKMEELRTVIPPRYFSPDFPITNCVNKVNQGDQVVNISSGSTEDLATQISIHEEWLKNPALAMGKDINAIAVNLRRLKEELYGKAAVGQPRQTDRIGRTD